VLYLVASAVLHAQATVSMELDSCCVLDQALIERRLGKQFQVATKACGESRAWLVASAVWHTLIATCM
jgi:hypothetical protein